MPPQSDPDWTVRDQLVELALIPWWAATTATAMTYSLLVFEPLRRIRP